MAEVLTHASPNGADPQPAYDWWPAFARRSWNRGPAVLRRSYPNAGQDEAAFLRALAAAATAHRHGQERQDFVIWADGRQLPQPWRMLPEEASHSLEAYLEIVDARLGAGVFTILLANPHLYDESLWRTARSVLRAGQRDIGLTCGGVDTCGFLGRYHQTPFGVHRGQMSVLTFPLLGQKRFLLWPFAYGEANTDMHDSLTYERHMPSSIEAVGGKGDILYWPADHWHIADGDGGYSAAWNIGFWFDRPPVQRLFEQLSGVLADRLGSEDAEALVLDPQGESAGLPPQTAASLEALRTTVRSPALETALLADWLAFASGDGFRDPPPLAQPLDLSRQAWRARDPVYAAECGEGLVVAANGHARAFAAGSGLRSGLDDLHGGRAVAPTPELLPLLEFLSACRALVPAENGP